MEVSGGKQVIVPALTFSCRGFIKGWAAHTLVITRDNFLAFLTHAITLQVWRPVDVASAHTSPVSSYTLVGFNQLRFVGSALRNGVTRIPGRDDVAIFSFNQSVEESERIHFVPGDVVGWHMMYALNAEPPLSVLYYTSSNSTTAGEGVEVEPAGGMQTTPVMAQRKATLHVMNSTRQLCNVCSLEEQEMRDEVVTSVIPLLSPIQG